MFKFNPLLAKVRPKFNVHIFLCQPSDVAKANLSRNCDLSNYISNTEQNFIGNKFAH